MRIRIWLLLAILASAITWLYTVRISGPYAQIVGERNDGIKIQRGDLYPRWVGTRELLLHRRSPYSAEVSREIQIGYYGKIIDNGDVYTPSGKKIVDQQRFAYPLYVIFLMAPSAYIDFPHVHRWAPVILDLFAALCVPICFRLLHTSVSWRELTAATLLTLASPQIVQGMLHQQLAILVGFFLLATAWCVSEHQLSVAGTLLAFSTIKPQMAILPSLFFLLWSAGDWRRRWRLPAAFISVMAILIGGAEIIVPGWIHDFLAGVAAYQKYFPTSSVLQAALGYALGGILGAIIVLVLAIYAWRNRHQPGDSLRFTAVFAWFLVGTILAFPLLTPFNQVVLLLPTFFLLRSWDFLSTFVRWVVALILGWPWITSTILLVFHPAIQPSSQLPLLPSLFTLVFPLLLPLFLAARIRDYSTRPAQ